MIFLRTFSADMMLLRIWSVLWHRNNWSGYLSG